MLYSGFVANIYVVTGSPTTIVVDKTGNISKAYYFQMVEPHFGYDNLVDVIKEELEKMIFITKPMLYFRKPVNSK